MLKPCPGSVDVTDLQFKLRCRLKIFDNSDLSTFTNPCNLISCASRYGLLFVGSNEKCFHVIQTQTLHNYSAKDKDIKDYPRRSINITSVPKHICVNCDNTILAVIVEKEYCPVAIFYDILSFLTSNIKVINEVRLSATPNVQVREVNWNPSLSGIFTACKKDGTLGVYELKGDSIEINELPTASGATCFCWSPKGKQIAVGSVNGNITQYKPDLKAVKIIPEPKFEVPHSLINIHWVSNYQFIGVYQQKSEECARVVVIDAPKMGEPVYTNYDDICYSGSSRPSQFYLIYQQNWNFLMVASANSTEIGVLGNVGDSWTQWNMPDSARAELPLSSDYQETFPIGLTLDISSTSPLPWGELSIPPCPIVCILSHRGVLCCFNLIFLKQGVPSICSPPDSISDQSGLHFFVVSSNQNMVTPQKTQFASAPIQNSSNVVAPKALPFSASVQSTPLATEKFLAGNTIFGEKPTLTPIKNSAIFGGQTLITPINKAVTTPTTNTGKVPDVGEKYSAIFSSINPSTASQISTPVKPIVITASNRSVEAKQEPPIEQKSKDPVTKPEIEKTEVVDPELRAETAAMLNQMIKEEWNILEMELLVLLKQCKSVKINVGSDKEMIDMVEQIESLQSFTKEASDISMGQSSEIQLLKQSLIQAWAWFEEARSHYNVSKNETVALLLKLQPLDSVAEKKLKDIKELIHYIDNQAHQANVALDEQWDNFQNHAKKSYKVKMPTMETIFQTMVKQSAILQKQAYVLKDISMRLRKKTSVSSSLLLSLDKTNDLADSLKDLRLTSQDIMDLQYEKIRHHTNSLTATKVKKLRYLVQQKGVTNITAIRPQLSCNMNRSITSKNRPSISIFGAHMPPVSKTSVARNLDFIPTTPQKEPTKLIPDIKALSTDPANQKSTLPSSTVLTPTSGFISIVKTGPSISSAKGSAFVPTGSVPFSAAPSFNINKTSLPNASVGNILGNKVETSNTTFAPSSLGQSIKVSNSTTLSAVNLVKPIQSATTTGGSLFGTKTFSFNSASSNTPSIFAGATDVTSKANSLKGNEPASSQTGTSMVFGNTPAVPTQNFESLFIKTPETLKSSPSSVVVTQAVETVKTVPPSNSIFEFAPNSSVTITPAGNTGLFGNLAKPISTTGVTQSSLFGVNSKVSFSITPSTQTPAISIETNKKNVPSLSFGITTTTSTATSVFGSVTSSPTVFGNVASLISSHPVGSTATLGNTTASVVSTPLATTATSSIFGTVTTSAPSQSFGIATSITSPFTTLGKGITSPLPVTTTLPISPTTTSTTITSSPPIFGSTTSSFFGSSLSAKPNAEGSTFFGTAASNKTVSTAVSPFNTTTSATTKLQIIPSASSSLFGKVDAVTTTSNNGNVTITPTASQSSSLFGNVPATSSTFPSLFGNSSNSESSSLFGNTVISKVTATTTSSIFSSGLQPEASVAAPSNVSIFGKVDTTTSGDSALVIPDSTSGKLFQVSTPNSTVATGNVTASASPSIFGQAASFAGSGTTPSNIFTSSSSNPIFGQTIPTATTTNVFGGSTTSSIFSTPAASSSNIFSQSVFGGASTTTSTTFGTQSSSLFGATQTPTNVFGASSVFGGQPPSTQPTTSASVFGQSNTFGGNSIFGSPSTTTPGSIFGTPPASSSGFGGGFGSTSTASSTFPAQTSTTGTFGFGSLNVGNSSGGIFGGSANNNFGQTPTENPFGKAESAPSFGSPATSFGSSPASTATTNVFGTPTTSTGSIFGSNTSSGFGNTGGSFGSQSTFTSSPFGQKPTFGQTPAFGSPSFGNTQNTGSFSGGGTSSVSQTGFGSPNTFQKSTGFGSPPVFGGSPAPAFGTPPTFGGTPSFGSTPAFGSPEKVFGATQPTGGFGSMSPQQTAGFGNLASQNTMGFGNLAQQAKSPSSMNFSGGASFSSWR